MSDSASRLPGSWTVGSAPECDIVVRQPVVSGRHCRWSVRGDQFVLEDLGSTNGTFVNGYRLEAHAPVFVSTIDTVTLGRSLPVPWPPAERGQTTAPAPAGATHVLSIGRNPGSDIQLDFPMISWNHARVLAIGNSWTIEDLGSRNGTSLNQIDNKITRAPLQSTDDIYLGSYKIAASRVLTERHLVQGEGAFERVRFQGDRMVLGRDPQADYALPYPMVSWHHAALERAGDGIYVQDLGSRNGTYVNGVRITARTLVHPGQEIGLGSFRFQLLEDGALAKREYLGNVTIEINGVAVNAPNGDRLLEPLSLTIFPSELVALMGPAGAGKTTLLKAMNGYTRPAAGRVLFNGADLYQFYDRFRQQMSYVPQDDIVHPQLTVREALYFSARLRTDLTNAEIEGRIDGVLESLGLLDKKHTIIGSPERKVLSGGQRKRVNIAMELIAAAPVIFLDEPTSGLSSYDAEGVVRVLKQLSTQGNTIITTIHQPSLDIFKQFDNLIMVSRDTGGRGELVYFGPAHPDSIEFFDPPGALALRDQPRELNPEKLLSGLATRTTADWASTYERSQYKSMFVVERSGKVPSTPDADASKNAVRKIGIGQWWTLLRRNLILKARDRAQALILLVQAPLFALLVGLIFDPLSGPGTRWPDIAKDAVGIHFLLVVAAIWFGCNNAARDIVGEWSVFQRERMVSLKLPSYVFAKLTVAALLSFVQCLMLLGIVHAMCDLQGDVVQMFGVLYLSSLVGSALGLCVSAVAPTTEAAIAMLPLILLPVIALGGGLTPVHEMASPVAAAAAVVPSRWAFEANLLTEAAARHVTTDVPVDVASQLPAEEVGGCDLAQMQFPTTNCVPRLGGPDGPPLDGAGPVKETRHALSTMLVILMGMLVCWTGAALAILRRRDIQ